MKKTERNIDFKKIGEKGVLCASLFFFVSVFTQVTVFLPLAFLLWGASLICLCKAQKSKIVKAIEILLTIICAAAITWIFVNWP